MMGCTHKMIALATSTLFVNFSTFDKGYSSIFMLAATAMTSSFPDLDIKMGKPHRQFSHSFLFVLVVSIIPLLIYRPIGIGILIGCGSHIIADSFTRMGVPMFYPYKKMLGFKKITTGETEDWTIFWLCFGYICFRIVNSIS